MTTNQRSEVRDQRSDQEPKQVLNNAIDYIRSLKRTQPGYADKVQDAHDSLQSALMIMQHQDKLQRADLKQLQQQRDDLRTTMTVAFAILAQPVAFNKEHSADGHKILQGDCEVARNMLFAAIARAEGRAS